MQSQQSQNEITLKIVLIGPTQSGKTQLSKIGSDKEVGTNKEYEYAENDEPTIGAAFKRKNIVKNNELLKLYIWDTAGQDRFISLAPMYWRGAHCIMLVWDLGDKEISAEKIENYLSGVSLGLNTEERKNVKILLVGTKSDLPSDKRISDSEFKEIADELEFECITASAKKNKDKNVEAVFQKAAEMGYKDYLEKNSKSALKIVPKKEQTKKEKSIFSSRKPENNDADRRQALKDALDHHMERINSYRGDQKKNTRSEFWILPNRRSKNREINYQLAKELRKALDTTQTLDQIFAKENVASLREPKGKVWSSDLQNIIEAGRNPKKPIKMKKYDKFKAEQSRKLNKK